MSTHRIEKDRQDSEMSKMQREISTLTKALTALSHKMVDRSSKRGGRGYKIDRGYHTAESEKENLQPNTRSRPDKRKFDEVEKKQSCPQHLIKKG